jgi:hypothetical protein
MDLNHRGPVGRRIYSPVQSTAMRYLQKLCRGAELVRSFKSRLAPLPLLKLIPYSSTPYYLTDSVAVSGPTYLLSSAYAPVIKGMAYDMLEYGTPERLRSVFSALKGQRSSH